MRVVVGTAVVLSVFAFAAIPIACGGSSDNTNVGGSGGSGGGGTNTGAHGTGGTACVPGTEVCDGVDNNCDGTVDEGCDCKDGDTQPCYSGPMGTENLGTCKGGTQTCDNTGNFGACAGEVVPADEECNGDDDDCNGMADDMGTQSCGVGACATTVDVCQGGQPVTCVPGSPTVEICDGVDNNCDQQTDETFPDAGLSCVTGNPGVCGPGTFACINGAQVCVGQNPGPQEQCNGLDDDCDGPIDNNVPGTGGACSTGQFGECAQGIVDCQNSMIDCFPVTPASPEVCDGLDNDCDGAVDQGDPDSGAVCMTGMPGLCATGVEHCLNGAISCVPDASISPEVCNGLDDNCDGATDENNPGGGLACGCGGTTACVAGAVVCQGGPVSYFSDDFSAGNSKGWTLGTEWTIGSATASANCVSCPGNDPATDHTATNDNGIAGVSIGVCTGTALHGDYCLTSPIVNTAAAPALYLAFWRHLHSDYQPFMTDKVDVSMNGGAAWTSVWTNAGLGCVNDPAWTKVEYNATAYKSAQFRFRICYSITSGGVYSSGSWNVDDVTLTAASCP